MQKIDFKQKMGDTYVGQCAVCGSLDFGFDRFSTRTYVYCRQCNEEVLQVSDKEVAL